MPPRIINAYPRDYRSASFVLEGRMSTSMLGDIYSIGSALTWSMGVIFLRQCTFQLSALTLNTFRTFAGFLFFFLILLIQQSPFIPELSREHWGLILASSVLGIFVGDMLYIQGLRRLGAGLAGIAAVSYVPMVILFAWLLFDEKIPAKSLIGGVLVIVAVLLSASHHAQAKTHTFKAALIGILFIMLSESAMSFAVVCIRPVLRSQSAVWVLAFRFMVGSLFFVPLSLRGSHFEEMKKLFKNRPLLIQTFWATLTGTILAVSLWLLGFKYTLAGRAAIYNQLSTIFIVIFAAIFLKEPLSRRKIAAVILAVVGAVLAA